MSLYVLFQQGAAIESHDVPKSSDLEQIPPEDRDLKDHTIQGTGEELSEQPEPELDIHLPSGADTECLTAQSTPKEVTKV